jgi:hypothetical protein
VGFNDLALKKGGNPGHHLGCIESHIGNLQANSLHFMSVMHQQSNTLAFTP